MSIVRPELLHWAEQYKFVRDLPAPSIPSDYLAFWEWLGTDLPKYQAEYDNQPAFLRGCRTGGYMNWKLARPQWVGAETTLEESIKVIEGRVPRIAGGAEIASSKITYTDFHPNHYRHDWNLFIRPDLQYRWMLTDQMVDFNGWGFDAMENEWDTRDLPVEHLPSAGDRVVLFGKHIFDCGHPPYRTEIHPPFGMVCMRPSGVRPTFPQHGHEAPWWRVPGQLSPQDERPDNPYWSFVPCTYGNVFFNRYGGRGWFPPADKPGLLSVCKYLRPPLLPQVPRDLLGDAIPRETATGRDYSFDVYPPARRPEDAGPLTMGFSAAQEILDAGYLLYKGLPSSTDPLFYRVTVRGAAFAKIDMLSFRFFCYWGGRATDASGVRRYRVRVETIEFEGYPDTERYKMWVGVTGSWVQLHKGDQPFSPGSWQLYVDLVATLLGDDPLRISVSGFEEDDCEDDDIGTRDRDWTAEQLQDLGLVDPETISLPQVLAPESETWRLTYRIERLHP